MKNYYRTKQHRKEDKTISKLCKLGNEVLRTYTKSGVVDFSVVKKYFKIVKLLHLKPISDFNTTWDEVYVSKLNNISKMSNKDLIEHFVDRLYQYSDRLDGYRATYLRKLHKTICS